MQTALTRSASDANMACFYVPFLGRDADIDVDAGDAVAYADLRQGKCKGKEVAACLGF